LFEGNNLATKAMVDEIRFLLANACT
jgi:hypothetical protein